VSGDTFDIAVVGSGFGGALLAMVAQQLGRTVVLLERGKHPRFAIGESTSPLTNLLIEEVARRYDLPRLVPLTSYGPWRRTYPEVVCGLKRGFTFFHHEPGRPYRADPDRRNQLLVAASLSDEVADTHWLRADVDHFFLREAVSLGVDYRDEAELTGADFGVGGATLMGYQHGEPFRLRAGFVVDATGPRGFLSRTLGLPEASFPGYPATRTLFSHFTSVRRCETMPGFVAPGTPPYPMDDAALHHVVPGGWAWVLRFDNGDTSAGVAVTEALADDLRLHEGEPAWHRFLGRFPGIAAQFADAVPVQPFRHAERLSYRCSAAAGSGWALLPSAAAFIDPLFSTGFPLTLLGIERLGRLLEENAEDDAVRLADYEAATFSEADWVARYIGACYAAFPCFDRFVGLSQFYFAAASYAEMARRLEKPYLARRFLAADDDAFRTGLERCETTWSEPVAFGRHVADAIAGRNVAGLHDPTKRNWYGVDLGDVVRAAGKLRMTEEAVRAVIATAPWARSRSAEHLTTLNFLTGRSCRMVGSGAILHRCYTEYVCTAGAASGDRPARNQRRRAGRRGAMIR
jgi:FADH2 O2-dependent halogenase